MPVERSGPDPGAAGDVVQGRLGAVLGECDARALEDPLAVAAGLRPQRRRRRHDGSLPNRRQSPIVVAKPETLSVQYRTWITGGCLRLLPASPSGSSCRRN